MSERGMKSPERTRSKVEETFELLHESTVDLGQVISHLEDRLTPVMNNYPRPSQSDNTMKEMEEPSGESIILSKLLSLKEDLNGQTDRIRILIDRLDI